MGLLLSHLRAIFLFWSFIFLGASMVNAERRLPDLNENMAAKDVIRLWGAPIERIERETKREEVWLYGESSVTFRSGKIVAWADASRAPANAQGAPPISRDAIKAPPVTDSDEFPVDALLEDIIGEAEKKN